MGGGRRTDRQADRDRGTERYRETETERKKDRETETETDRDSQRRVGRYKDRRIRKGRGGESAVDMTELNASWRQSVLQQSERVLKREGVGGIQRGYTVQGMEENCRETILPFFFFFFFFLLFRVHL